MSRAPAVQSLVLRSAGAKAVRDGGTRFDAAEFLASVTTELSITEAEAIESLEVLDSARVIKIHRTSGQRLSVMRTFDLTDAGLETYLHAYEPDYFEIQATAIAVLATWPHDQGSDRELTDAVGPPRLIVQHVLDRCAARRMLKVSKAAAGPSDAHFFGISPQLRHVASS